MKYNLVKFNVTVTCSLILINVLFILSSDLSYRYDHSLPALALSSCY